MGAKKGGEEEEEVEGSGEEGGWRKGREDA